MSPLTSLLTGFPAQALAWALVHFLWQGAAIALLAVVAMRWVATTASARYIVGVVGLTAMFAAPVVTFVAIGRSAASDLAGLAPLATIGAAHLGSAAASDATWRLAPRALPFIAGAWILGVLLLSMRLLGGWLVTRRLVRRAVGPVAAEVDALARRVADRIRLRRFVQVVESSAVSAPILIGWLKPVVLLPAAALSGLTPGQLEGLLAHELAHIRRHDYLVNLFQSVVETLLFYHPAVWWLSAQVRAEREHCCDDLAVGVSDRLVYVSALTDLAAMTTPRLALGATDGSLLARVRRILGAPGDARPAPPPVALVVVLLLAGTVMPIALTATPAGSGRAITTGAVDAIPQTDVHRSHASQDGSGADRSAAADPLDALRRQLIDAEEEIEILRRHQDALHRQRADADFARRIDRATLEIGAIRAERDEAKAAVASGRSGPAALAAVEARLAAAELGLEALVDERTFQASMADLESRRSERARSRERLAHEYQEALSARQRAAAEAEALKQQRAADVESQLERRRAERIEAERRASAQQPGDVPVPADGVYGPGPGVVDPRLTKEVRPLYTREAMDARIQGSVQVEAIIRKDGTVGEARITRSLDTTYGLDDQALEAARQWRFEPATVKGAPVDYRVTIELWFRLK